MRAAKPPVPRDLQEVGTRFTNFQGHGTWLLEVCLIDYGSADGFRDRMSGIGLGGIPGNQAQAESVPGCICKDNSKVKVVSDFWYTAPFSFVVEG